MHSPNRRRLLQAAALTPAAAILPLRFVAVSEAQAAAPNYAQPPERFFSSTETSFVEAAVARIIPADELGPGAKEAGVADFISEGWPASSRNSGRLQIGIHGRLPSESVAGLPRNQWPPCIGLRIQIARPKRCHSGRDGH